MYSEAERGQVYIAAPFDSMSVDRGDKAYGVIVDQAYIAFLESIEAVFQKCGFSTVLPHKVNDWGRVYIEPAEMGKIDFELIASSKLLVAYPQDSRGVHVEIGYAAGLGKPVIVLLGKEEQESPMISGLSHVTQATFIRFQTLQDLLVNLESAMKQLAS